MAKKKPEDQKKDQKKTSNQQKPKSGTSKTVTQPKPEPQDPPDLEVNLCEECVYDFGNCDGKPKFAIDFNDELTGAAADRVVQCEGFLDLSSIPAADEVEGKKDQAAAPGPAAAEESDQERKPWALALERLDDFGKAQLNARAEEIIAEAERRYEGEENPSVEDMAATLVLIVQDIISKEGGPSDGLAHDDGDEGPDEPEEPVFIPAPGPVRPDPKRFAQEEDLGNCQSCQRPLKRTAYSEYVDAVRCMNPRCPNYRNIVRTMPTGVK